MQWLASNKPSWICYLISQWTVKEDRSKLIHWFNIIFFTPHIPLPTLPMKKCNLRQLGQWFQWCCPTVCKLTGETICTQQSSQSDCSASDSLESFVHRKEIRTINADYVIAYDLCMYTTLSSSCLGCCNFFYFNQWYQFVLHIYSYRKLYSVGMEGCGIARLARLSQSYLQKRKQMKLKQYFTAKLFFCIGYSLWDSMS